jgi:hypothetical protein
LDSDDPESIEKMIEFMYKGNYLSAKPSLLTHTKICILGDPYNIPSLKTLAKMKYGELLPSTLETSAFKPFTDSLILMYSETPDSDHLLKDIAARFAGANASQLLSISAGAELQSLVKNGGELAYDMFRATAQALVDSIGNLRSPELCPECESEIYV